MNKVQTRETIAEGDKWKLEDIFHTEHEWIEAYKKCETMIEKAASYKGQLNDNATNLLEFLNLKVELGQLYEKVAVYARMREDENTKDTERQALVQKISPLALKYSESLSFFSNELLNIPEDKLKTFYDEKEELVFYKKYLDDILREKAHILSPEQEEIMAQTSLLGNANSIFGKLNNSDLTFETIVDGDGNKLELTHSSFGQHIQSSDRNVRKQAFENLYKAYDSLKNTLAGTYLASIKEDFFSSKVRKYNSCLEHALFSDDVSVDVYENLIKNVKENADSMHKYVSLRKKMLGLEKLHMYDMYAPLVADAEQKISYAEAYETMKKGLSVLGDEYVELLDKAREERWIDVYETDGKRSGAYAWGPYGVHPYVLLNHREDIDSMFTLAHEMGHALHSYYSDRENPYLYAQYTIFVAEVASTVNEVLLMHYLLNNTTDKKLKMSLINEFLEKFKGTLFRQTMFAEFEKITHEKIETGEPMTVDEFSNIYYKLNQEYYGDSVVHDEQIKLEWARIPHFYRAFYVYQYATGFSAAIAIADRILSEGDTAVEDYLKFLKSGGTNYPIELLKIAGVDMSKPEPIENALRMFSDLVCELEKLNEEE